MQNIDDHTWFHALQFPDGTSSAGRFSPKIAPNYSLYGPLSLLPHCELAGAKALDIGTMDGLMAFSLAAAGAQVTATDIAPRASFELARQKLGVALDYRVPFLINAMRHSAERWDFIACCGILYHVFDPLPVLVTLRQSLREGGLLLLETQYQWAQSGAQILFCPSQPRATRYANTFFRPSFEALHGMVEMAGFQPLATISVLDRIAVLARAERPSRIVPRQPMVRTVLDRYADYANYREDVDYRALEADNAGQPPLAYRGPCGNYALHASAYRPHQPFEPAWTAPLAARARDWAARLGASAARRGWLAHWPQS